LEKDLGRDSKGEACNRIEDLIELSLDEIFVVLQLPPQLRRFILVESFSICARSFWTLDIFWALTVPLSDGIADLD
jgi:hypothetical protein